MTKKKKTKKKLLSNPEVNHVKVLIEFTKSNIKNDDSEFDKLWIGQLERLKDRLRRS